MADSDSIWQQIKISRISTHVHWTKFSQNKRRRWRTTAATATDSEAKSAVSAFAYWAPDKIISKRRFVWGLRRRRRRRWWWRMVAASATDSEAKSAVSAFAYWAPDKIISKRRFVWGLRRRRRRWWWRMAAASATDSEAKSAVSAFADRAPLLLSSSQFHIKVCSICRMDNFHVPLGNRWRFLSVWYESYMQELLKILDILL